mmetsp:Transcript_21469/g.33087  ORF Transcript_21469/g.33087 Transcript_21469/m.33087 type:complete len:176 (-) Transcript_21469:332-859(-)
MSLTAKIASGGGTVCAIPPKQFATILESLCPHYTFTTGATEALRQSHSRLLQLIAAELASVWDDNDNAGITANETIMEQCLERLGMDGLCAQMKTTMEQSTGVPTKKSSKKVTTKRKQSAVKHTKKETAGGTTKRGRKKKEPKFQITEEMMAEQERLLGLSKKQMESSSNPQQME